MLPDFIPQEAWEGFVEMRKKMRKPMTERAVKMMITTLTDLHTAGHDVAACLDQSTKNSWLDVYECRERRNEPRQGQRPVLSHLGKQGQATANNVQDWLEGL
jgi:hypothetical protein